jgi:hypothetical protein
VARLLGDHGEDEEAQVAIVERPGAAGAAGAAAVMMMVVVVAPVTAIRQVIGVAETTV